MPSEVCTPANYDMLHNNAIQAALKQSIISADESIAKFYIGNRGEVVNFVVKM